MKKQICSLVFLLLVLSVFANNNREPQWVTVGAGDQLARMPVDMFYQNSLFETIYYPSELNNTQGFIIELKFYNSFVTNLPAKPTKIWLGTTTLENLADGWIPSTQLQLVYDGLVNYPSGQNIINIVLNTPFPYNGGNLVMMVNRPMDSTYYSSADTFYCQTLGTNRSRNIYSDTVIFYPANPSGGELSGQFPKTSFLFAFPVSLTGTIAWQYDNSPASNITVRLYDETQQQLVGTSVTNELGEYSFTVEDCTNYKVAVSAQSIIMNGEIIYVPEHSVNVSINGNTTADLAVMPGAYPVNSDNCTFIGYYNGHSYWRSNWTTQWEYAYNECVNRGGHLLTIANAGENQYFTDYFAANPNYNGGAWIGLRNTGSWYWIDGTPFTYTNWAPGEPSGDSEVGVMNNIGTWNDHWYWDAYYQYIMESNGLVTPLAPQSITGLNIQQQRDFTVNLSWTNPSEVICGLSLLNGFDIVIKRDGVVVASLTNCTAGAALNWQDFVITGRHTYAVLAVNEYGESTPVSQSISYGNQVQGVALLNNVADHSGIKVLFIADPSTPAAVSDSTYTNINGFYSINLTIGRYRVIYSKAGYLDQTYNNYLHDGAYDLPEQTLEYVGTIMNLSGSLSGTLTADYAYIINSQIWVDSGNTLTIEPGVRFYFKNGVGFDVNGVLTAIGTTQNPILFTSVTSEIRGDIWLNNSSSVMERCELLKGYYGLRINSNAHVSHSKIHDVSVGVSIHENANADCLFDYNEIFDCNEMALELYSYGVRFEHNEIYDNTLNSHIIRIYHNGRGATFTNNYIHNNSTLNSHMIYLHGVNVTLNMSNNIIENNSSPHWFLYGDGCDGRIYSIANNIFRNNTTGELIGLYGSGIFENNQIINNQGSVHVNGWDLFVRKNLITESSGNGLMIWGGSSVNVSQNTVKGNLGVGIVVHDSPSVRNNIVAFNGGTELVNNTGNNSIYHNLFYDSSGTILDNPGGLPFLLDMQALNVNGTPCDSYFNISTDPLFFDVLNSNYNLLPTSPCINAGDPASALDPDGTIADLGAYYYDLNASTHPQIAIPLSLYNFQSIAVGDTLIWNCPVRNTGTDPLIISSIQLNNPVFYLETETRSIIPFSITIQPNQTGYIPIGFTPAAVADYADTLRINSNALMNPQVSIRIFGAGTTSSSITLAMPQNNVVNVLSDLQLPLSVSDTTPYNLLSYNMSLSYDPAIFEFISLETVGTLCTDWFTAVNSVSLGVLHIGASGVNPLSGSGNLFKLNFHTLSGILDGTESFININQVTFNEGGISLQGCFAAVTIRNIIYGDVDENNAIQAYDAALTLQYSVMMDPLPVIDPRPWLDWRKLRADVSGDGNIFAYDASLILQRVVGLITVFPVEQTRPEPPLATVEISFYNNQLVVSTPDFGSLYGLNLSAWLPEGISLGQPQLSEAFAEAVWNQYTCDGVWNFALACLTPQTGSGTICTIPVSANAATELSFSLVANETESQQSVSILPLEVPETPEIAFNYLAPNIPNPFNPSTAISYGLKEPARVELGIYNLKGQKVKSLVNTEQGSGAYRVVWNGNDDHNSPVGSGIYFCRIKIGTNWSKTQKMMLMK